MMGSSLAVSHNRACNFESPITRFKLVVGPLAFGWNRALFFLSFTGGVSFPYTNYARNPRDDRSQNPPPRGCSHNSPHDRSQDLVKTHSNNPLIQDDRSQNFPHGRSFTQSRARSSAESHHDRSHNPPHDHSQEDYFVSTQPFTHAPTYTIVRRITFPHNRANNAPHDRSQDLSHSH